MRLKAVLREMIRKSGYDLVRFVPELNRPFPLLPLVVRDRVERSESFVVVQVGANDGILDDPLRDLVCRYHFPGLLIEPLPDLFEKLRLNYRGEPQLLFENVAIVTGPDRMVPIYRVRNDATVPRHWHGIASFERKNLLMQGVSAGQIDRVHVQGTSFHSLVAKHGISRIGLLQIDTEGYDHEIVRAAFQAGIFPDIINYEHCWLVPNVRFRCKKLLDEYGYQFVEAGKDTLAVRPSR